MKIWQADFYRRPLKTDTGEVVWELLLCEPNSGWVYAAQCPQSQANSTWLATQINEAAKEKLPQQLHVFRPQALSLLTAAADSLEIAVEPTRRTPQLKEQLRQRVERDRLDPRHSAEAFDPVAIEKAPPQPLPEDLQGERWSFAAIAASELDGFLERPIPVQHAPELLLPINLGLASNLPIPGVVIFGGRTSMRLVRWLETARPVAIAAIPTSAGLSGGLVLEAGLSDRFIIATYEDAEVAAAAKIYEQRKQAAKELHFLLVQPDDSGMTYSGIWLLRTE